MSRYWQIISLTFVVLLASCASNEQVYRSNGDAEESVAIELELERQQQVADAKAIETRRKADATAREEASRQREAAKIAAEQEAARKADAEQQVVEQQRRQAAEQAQALARQQTQVDELRAQVNANNAETVGLEAANESLREAITTAEDLSVALSTEQQKYSNTDPATGEILEGLARATIDELSAEVERLKEQAEILQSVVQ